MPGTGIWMSPASSRNLIFVGAEARWGDIETEGTGEPVAIGLGLICPPASTLTTILALARPE